MLLEVLQPQELDGSAPALVPAPLWAPLGGSAFTDQQPQRRERRVSDWLAFTPSRPRHGS